MHGPKLSDLANLVLSSYLENGFTSTNRISKALDHLSEFFGADIPAVMISALEISRYVRSRLDDGAARATVNRELEALRRGMTLAVRYGLLSTKPHVPRLREDSARKGFVEREQLKTLLDQLPVALRSLIQVAAITGWRVRSELLPMTWMQVDFEHDWIRLEPGSTKNREGREFPMFSELRTAFIAQRKISSSEIWVFPGRNGAPLRSFPKSWRRATKAAGLDGLHVHDLRRSAARNMIRAGISPIVVMKLCGWRSIAMLQRYAIVEHSLLAEAGEKLQALGVR